MLKNLRDNAKRLPYDLHKYNYNLKTTFIFKVLLV